VALVIADAESAGASAVAGPQVGLSSTQLPRFVLDTCATAAAAAEALLDAKQHDLGLPLHYLVADPSGDAFGAPTLCARLRGSLGQRIEPQISGVKAPFLRTGPGTRGRRSPGSRAPG
jgi:hypothetical protein